MLKERVVTAVIMLIVFLGVLFAAPASVFALLVAIIVGIAAWEWSRLCGLSNSLVEIAYPTIVGLVALIVMDAEPAESAMRWLMLLGVLCWGAMLVALATVPVLRSVVSLEASRMALGLVVLPIAGIAIFYLRHLAPEASEWLLLYAMALVWVMDTGAYFAGKRFGRRKLAPLISPGKTWEGVFGGLACTAVLVVFVLLVTQLSAGGLLRLLIASIASAGISVVGDLYESRMKRASGFKDSSNLLPGHGGVLDRIDGLIVSLPVFVFFWVWM
ncbi:MAG: phosphatidate cytidylyltransferase [Gammaproteobacteria bacterium]|nr:phosphatidate cytidylyltransferase [Gammaproteobacteria bacterium]